LQYGIPNRAGRDYIVAVPALGTVLQSVVIGIIINELPRRKRTGYQEASQAKPPQGAGNQTQRD
jgi:hypothetical protein